METCIEEILSIIGKASLPFADVKNWEKVLENVPPELCPNVLYFLKLSPNSIPFLNENLKKQIEAVENLDENLWYHVLDEQKNYAEAYALRFF